ncbi:MAG: hypothetical protein ACKVJW_05940 [Flavobacteriales bacterium]
MISCGGKEEKKDKKIQRRQKPKVEIKKEEPKSDVVLASKRVTLDNKGIGKVKNVELIPTIDNAMVERGDEQETYKQGVCSPYNEL